MQPGGSAPRCAPQALAEIGARKQSRRPLRAGLSERSEHGEERDSSAGAREVNEKAAPRLGGCSHLSLCLAGKVKFPTWRALGERSSATSLQKGRA